MPAVLKALIQRLGDSIPGNCDLSKIGPLHMATFYNVEAHAGIREDSYCGMALDEDTAITKALVEFVERQAYIKGAHSGHPLCQTERSDGFAAFPSLVVGQKFALEQARMNALGEAIERYVWATWWDDVSVGATLRPLSTDLDVTYLTKEIEVISAVREWIEVHPYCEDSTFTTVIVFARLTDGGVVSGGASGPKGSQMPTRLRALGELARHAVVAERLKSGTSGKTFYERRLAFMASPLGGAALARRLDMRGQSKVELPKLALDGEVPHRLQDAVVVYRCLFENQPPFVGGDLERLCL